MLKIKNMKFRITAALLCTILAVSGCGAKNKGSATDAMVELDDSQFLNMDTVYNDTKSTSGYRTIELEYGTFETQMSGQSVDIIYPDAHHVKAKYETGKMIFTAYNVEQYGYVEKGDYVAYVTMETNPIDIEEAKLHLQRTKEDYVKAKQDYEESVTKREDMRNWSDLDRKIQVLKYEIEDLTWEHTAKGYERTITDIEKNLKELEADAQTIGIKADVSGYVMEKATIREGDEIKSGTSLVTLVPMDRIYVQANDQLMSYNYGQDYTFVTKTGSSSVHEFPTSVVSASQRALYGNLRDFKARLIISDMDINELFYSWGWTFGGTISKIEHVLLIPKDAVEKGEIEKDERCDFVLVMNEDGSVVRTPFIAGGHNSDYYWVLSGLEEGTKIVVK